MKLTRKETIIVEMSPKEVEFWLFLLRSGRNNTVLSDTNADKAEDCIQRLEELVKQ